MDHDKHRRAGAPATSEAATEAVKAPKVAKGRVTPKDTEAAEAPEDYSDPICVCEPEPYWQEVAERLEREAHAPK